MSDKSIKKDFENCDKTACTKSPRNRREGDGSTGYKRLIESQVFITKTVYIAILISTILAVSVATLLLSWLFLPEKPYLTVLNYKVTNEAKVETNNFCPGDSVRFVWNVEVTHQPQDPKVWTTFQRVADNDVINGIALPPIQWLEGSSRQTTHFQIPRGIPPGEYAYVVHYSYLQNPLKYVHFQLKDIIIIIIKDCNDK